MKPKRANGGKAPHALLLMLIGHERWRKRDYDFVCRVLRTVFNASPPRKTQVARRMGPSSVSTAKAASSAYVPMAARNRGVIVTAERLALP